ncbi:MAG: 5-formyltetrahydrofolate cyclo-ligase [Rhizomicrobium sp.]
MPSALADKVALRQAARARRQALADADFAQALARHGEGLRFESGAIIAGYHPRSDEADPTLLLKRLAARGAGIAFPRIAQANSALHFHLIPEGEALQPGCHGIHEPLERWPEVRPEVILVPLLAYDKRGYRLGYGGGYYDRTLALLAHVRAIGIAYSGQEVPELPAASHDVRLHALISEKGMRVFRP